MNNHFNHNSNPLQQVSPNKSFSSIGGQGLNTLGLEKHVKHIFMQTQNTITSLNNELDEQKKTNEELQWKLTDLNSQKQSLLNKNKKLDQDLHDCKLKVDDLLKCKNDYKAQILSMKKELQNINDDWEFKKKELMHQINQLKEQQFQYEDERNREKIAFEQATKIHQTKIDSINYSVESTNEEIRKYDAMIAKLKEREKFSMDTIMNETFKFKNFLECQSADQGGIGSMNVSKVQM